MEVADKKIKVDEAPKEIIKLIDVACENPGLYPESIFYEKIKDHLDKLSTKTVKRITETAIQSAEFKLKLLNHRCKIGDELACDMMELLVMGDKHSRILPVQKGLMGQFKIDGSMNAGKMLVEIGRLSKEEFNERLKAKSSDTLMDGRRYEDILNDVAKEAKTYETYNDFSMAMIMGRLSSIPAPIVKNFEKLIRDKYKNAEAFFNAVKLGEYKLEELEKKQAEHSTGGGPPEPVIVERIKKIPGTDIPKNEMGIFKRDLEKALEGTEAAKAEAAKAEAAKAEAAKADAEITKKAKKAKEAIKKISEEFYGKRAGDPDEIYANASSGNEEAIEGLKAEINERMKLLEKPGEKKILAKEPVKIYTEPMAGEDDGIRETPSDFNSYTFEDFEPMIYIEEDIDVLDDLYETISISNKLQHHEKQQLQELITKRIEEIEHRHR